MLGFLYLILILGWMLIVIFLKCKKTLSQNISLSRNNYPDQIDIHPSIHVIQLHPEDYTDTSNGYHSIIVDENNYHIDTGVNPAYSNDDEFIISAPPPSYEEVMRQPDVYPKVEKVIKPNIQK